MSTTVPTLQVENLQLDSGNPLQDFLGKLHE